jgi:hypothetical protein
MKAMMVERSAHRRIRANGCRREVFSDVLVPVGESAHRHHGGPAALAAALAAGGRMVRDEFAPSWWTLADAVGNEVDIATTRGRD